MIGEVAPVETHEREAAEQATDVKANATLSPVAKGEPTQERVNVRAPTTTGVVTEIEVRYTKREAYMVVLPALFLVHNFQGIVDTVCPEKSNLTSGEDKNVASGVLGVPVQVVAGVNHTLSLYLIVAEETILIFWSLAGSTELTLPAFP